MRVLAEMGLLLVLGLVVGLRSDGVFIAGLLLAVSVAGLVEWLRPAQWSWVLCTAYLVIAVAVPSWCAFMPLIAYDTARLPALASTGARAGARTAASGRSPSVSRTAASRRSLADAMRSAPWLSAAARWIWVLPLIALWFARGTDRLQTLVMTLVALLGFVLGRARASSDEARRALLHAQDRARESSRATRSRIADIDEERAQSIRMATLGERTRIAREIHDNVGHLLTRAIMQAQAGKTVAKATNDTVAAQGFATLGATLDDAMTMVRRSVHDLEDDGTDFAAQIDDAVTSFDGISPRFRRDAGQRYRQGARAGLALFRDRDSRGVVERGASQRGARGERDVARLPRVLAVGHSGSGAGRVRVRWVPDGRCPPACDARHARRLATRRRRRCRYAWFGR